MSQIEAQEKQADKPFALKVLLGLWWILESQWWVVFAHTDGLMKSIKAGSPTGLMVLIWAPLMCFPQWVIAPLFGWHLETLSIFAARMAAMCIVRKLDDTIPLTRALGICHLITFGPVLTLLLMSDVSAASDPYFSYFLLSQIYVIGLCLVLDARDFFFYLGGHPFPCYVREGARAGSFDIADPRAHEAVNWRTRLLGP